MYLQVPVFESLDNVGTMREVAHSRHVEEMRKTLITTEADVEDFVVVTNQEIVVLSVVFLHNDKRTGIEKGAIVVITVDGGKETKN